MDTVNVLKFQTLFLPFSIKMLVIRIGIRKMLVRIANREDPDQTNLGLHCLSMHFQEESSVQNFRTFTVFARLQTT